MGSGGAGTKAVKAIDAKPIARIEPQLALLARALEAAQKRRVYPLERAHYLLIDVLEKSGPQPVGELARRLLLDDSTVTRQLAAMDELGLIARTSNPDDRRMTRIEVTARGRTLAAATRTQRVERIGVLLGAWSEAERAQLAAMIERLNADFFRLLADADRAG